MRYSFEKCFQMLLEHEGGFVNHEKDRGGMTNLGITRRTYERWVHGRVSEEEMRALTPDDVRPIYKAQYWDKVKGDRLPEGVDWVMFDWAVNAGITVPSKALQQISGVAQDGIIGPDTLRGVNRLKPKIIVEELSHERQRFYMGLDNFDTFGEGWIRRSKRTQQQAYNMII